MGTVLVFWETTQAPAPEFIMDLASVIIRRLEAVSRVMAAWKIMIITTILTGTMDRKEKGIWTIIRHQVIRDIEDMPVTGVRIESWRDTQGPVTMAWEACEATDVIIVMKGRWSDINFHLTLDLEVTNLTKISDQLQIIVATMIWNQLHLNCTPARPHPISLVA